MPIWATLIALEDAGEVTVGVIHNPVTGEMLAARRGGGARLNGERVRVSAVDELRQATLLHAGLKLLRETPHWDGFVRLVDATDRQRGFGDYLGYALVAEGKAEIYAETDLKAWDLAPCKVIVEEAGGRFTDFAGVPDASTAARPSPPTAGSTPPPWRSFNPARRPGPERDGVGAVQLAVHPGALGDVLLAVPALRALRATSSAPLVLAAQPRIGALLEALGVVDGHVAFDALGLDALFVADADSRPRLPAVRAGGLVVRRARPGLRPASDRIRTGRGRRAIRGRRDVRVGASAAYGRRSGRRVVRADPHQRDAAPRRAPRMLAATGFDGPPPFLFVHPGAGSAAKCWPAEAFARTIATVAARSRMNAFVHQGPADAAAASALRRHIGRGVAWLVEPSLAALAGALARATVFLGNDSGVSHLAAALGIPSVILFDAGNLAWRPWADPGAGADGDLSQVVDSEVEAVVADVRRLLA